FATLDQQAQDLLNAVSLHCQLARNSIDERVFMGTQQCTRAHGSAAQPLPGKDSIEQLIREAAANPMISREPSTVVLGERPSVDIQRFDTSLVAYRCALTAH